MCLVIVVCDWAGGKALMALSLCCLVYEVWISGGALRILLNAVNGKDLPRGCDN